MHCLINKNTSWLAKEWTSRLLNPFHQRCNNLGEFGVKKIFYSLALGLGMGAIGVFLMGYIAAVAIPKEFFFVV